MFCGGDNASVCSKRSAVSSQGKTSRGELALTIAAKANTHCNGVALSGRCPTLVTNRLFSASVLRGASSDTSKPALLNADGMRAVPM